MIPSRTFFLRKAILFGEMKIESLMRSKSRDSLSPKRFSKSMLALPTPNLLIKIKKTNYF